MIVTGGARGQGAVEAELLAQCGAQVMICDMLEEEGEAHARELCDAGYSARLDRTA